MAVDVQQITAAPTEQVAPQPVGAAPEAASIPAEAPAQQPLTPEAPQAQETPPEQPPVAVPAKQSVEERIAQLEKNYQLAVQERDYYKGGYTSNLQQQEAFQEKQRDDAKMAELRQAWLVEVKPQLDALERGGHSQDSSEYQRLYNHNLLIAQAEWKDYLADKKLQKAQAMETDVIRRGAEYAKNELYTAASVTHRMPLEKLRQILPRTDNLNVIDLAARIWRMATDEATRSLSASQRIAMGVDNIPTGAGVGGQTFAYLEDAEAALSEGKIPWSQFESLRAKLRYRDGTTPSY